MLDAFEVFFTLLLPGSHPLKLMSVLPFDVFQHLLKAQYLFHKLISSPLKLLLTDPLRVKPGECCPCHLINGGQHVAAVAGDLRHRGASEVLTPEI